ncbi:hypothetical protein [Vagococcus hydrophili]|uniref:Lipoprotein n=1 Tax=Vagococcus hydrophili TaxID=2714947 RepID=A0A6G8AST8_9ENTE|nr:hypothetical protein [Vagococcus hydrophili]QIL47995.1 hypothetical protein G7082_05330 [Vagococcus hydrophili]
MEKKKQVVGTIILFFSLFLVTACKGSADIQSNWYAVNKENQKARIEITENEIKIKPDGAKEEVYSYKQVGTGIENNRSYKTLEVVNQGSLSVVFPNRKDKDKAVLLVPNNSDSPMEGKISWSLGKEDYPDSEMFNSSLKN